MTDAFVVRRLWSVEGPNALALQGIFAVLLALDLAVTSSVASGRLWGAPATVAVLLAGAGLVVAGVEPFRRVPHLVLWCVPLVDLVALGLVRIGSPGTGADVLCVIPAIWLAWELGYRGAVSAGVVAVASMSVPWLVVLGPVEGNIAGALLVPFVVVMVGLVVAWHSEHLQLRHAEATRIGSELRDALDAAEHHRGFNAAILDTVDVGLVLLGADGRYLAVNRRHREFMQLAFPQGHAGVAGQDGEVYEADGVTRMPRERMPAVRASRGEEFDDIRIWCGRSSEARRALSVSARIVRDGDGNCVGAALAYKDVTDFMEALAVKDEFLASVSHELRTPLTSILGYTQLLLEGEQSEEPLESRHLAIVERNAVRLSRLVADLLQTSRVDQGALTFIRSEACLSEIVRESVRAARPVAEAGGLRIDVDVPETLMAVVDGQRMAQVVDNLLSNAIKYTPAAGAVRISLSVGDTVCLRVSDTGIGISAEDRERLFTRFFRARAAEGLSVQGIGLGLSITKSIVEAHGGRVVVDSAPGVGSTFSVQLPLSVLSPSRAASASA